MSGTNTTSISGERDTPRRPTNGLDRFFAISERGSTVSREVRGGLVTFFTMAYIIVLNPLIIGTVPDADGNFLGGGAAPNLAMVASATALVAGVLTILMGVFANFPLALATGLGLNAFVAFSIASEMSWADAMGLVVIEGLIILGLVLTGFRVAVFRAVPSALKIAISVGIGLFIAFIGLVDGGIVRRNPDAAGTPVPVGFGVGGELQGWPTFVFVVGLLAMIIMIVLRVKGAILIGIVGGTILAIIVETIADIGPSFTPPDQVNPHGWGLNVPAIPDDWFETPDFGLLGQLQPARVVGPRRLHRGRALRLHPAARRLLRHDGHDDGDRRRGRAARQGRHAAEHAADPDRRLGCGCGRRCGQRVQQHVVHRVRRGCR